MRSAFKITLIYIVFASIWIISSDRIITYFSNRLEVITFLSSLKGLLFVLVTGLLLFILVRKEIKHKNLIIKDLNKAVTIKQQLISELHHRIKNNLQVVIGLLNIEPEGKVFSPEAKDKIVSKLLSMKSVFNIVYDLEDMKNISFNTVLNEYARIGHRSIKISHCDENQNISVETIVTLLLLIDTILYCFKNTDTIIIDVVNDTNIEIYSETVSFNIGQCRHDEIILMDLLAESIHGKADIMGGRIRISYDDRISA